MVYWENKKESLICKVALQRSNDPKGNNEVVNCEWNPVNSQVVVGRFRLKQLGN